MELVLIKPSIKELAQYFKAKIMIIFNDQILVVS